MQINVIGYSPQLVSGGLDCILTGWGYTTPIRIGQPPNDLQQTRLKTLTNEQCMEHRQMVDKTGICTEGVLARGACGVSLDQHDF